MPVRIFGDDSPLPDPLRTMTRESFVPLLRSSFVANSGSTKPTWLTLVAVEDTTTADADLPAGAPKTAAFALRFQGVGEPLKQGMHKFEHQTLGQFALFIVPSGDSSYTAIINHLVAPLPPNYSIPFPKPKPAAAAAAEIRSRILAETQAV